MSNRLEKGEHNVTCSPFIDGGIDQSSFDEQARRGLEQYSQTFGKYLSDKDGAKISDDEKMRRDRAKKANKIYKQVCEDLRLKACFFSNFGDWSDYIEGKMSDAEFESHAQDRAQQMMADN